MHNPCFLCRGFVVAFLSVAACHDTTSPGVALSVTRQPDFGAAVTASTYQHFFSPAGWVSQYEIRVTMAYPDTGSAGVFLGASRPVFIRRASQLARATPGDIAPGDFIQVWTDGSVGHGQAGFPVATPIYSAIQVLIGPVAP